MGYMVVYDAAMEQFQWWPRVGIPILMLLFSLILVLADHHHVRKGGTSRFHPRQRLGFYAMPALAALALMLTAIFPYRAYQSCQNLVQSNSLIMIDGLIEDYQPSSGDQGQPEEYFRVNNIQFAYKESPIDCGFDLTARQALPMRDGLPVRIGYVLKLAGDENIICYLAIKNAP